MFGSRRFQYLVQYWEQEPSPFRSEVARAIRQTSTSASREATGPDEVQENCLKHLERQYWTEFTEYVWRSGKLASGQRNGRSPRSTTSQERLS